MLKGFKHHRVFVLLLLIFPAIINTSIMEIKSKAKISQINFPSLEGATGWLNSQKLTNNDLQGKVVLIQFWTFTCVNWMRTLPYVRAWEEKYRGDGLKVIGVHTPEFSFEYKTE